MANKKRITMMKGRESPQQQARLGFWPRVQDWVGDAGDAMGQALRDTRDYWADTGAREQDLMRLAYTPVQGRTPVEWSNDALVSLGTGIQAGIPEAVVGGLTELPPFSLMGERVRNAPYRAMESLGLNPAAIRAEREKLYSPAQQRANAALREADGITGTAHAVIDNPSAVVMQGVESLPLAYGAARTMATKPLRALGGKIGGWIRPAEGATGKWADIRRAVTSKPAVGIGTDLTASASQNLGQASFANPPEQRLTDGERWSAIGAGAVEAGVVPAIKKGLGYYVPVPKGDFETSVISGNVPAQVANAGPKAIGEGVANQMFSPEQQQAPAVQPTEEYADRERWDMRRWR